MALLVPSMWEHQPELVERLFHSYPAGAAQETRAR